jgi:putative flippase GtrA
MIKKLLQYQFIRFCIVGAINTSVDVSLFTFLHIHHMALILANICSTTLGLLISLFLNYKFTFRSLLSKTKIVIYFAVTVFGLWVMQPIFISLVIAIISHTKIVSGLLHSIGHVNIISNVIAKLFSISITLVWNYAWYSKVVFKNSPASTEKTLRAEVF